MKGGYFSKGRDFAAWLGLVPKQISKHEEIAPFSSSISKSWRRIVLSALFLYFFTLLKCAISQVLFVQAAWVTLVKVSPNKWQGHGLKPWIEAGQEATAP